MTRTSPAPVRVARRSRKSLILTLFATALVVACGGDSGSQPEEDGETSEARVLRPGTVRTLAVAGVTARAVELRFTQVSDGVSEPASYEVRYSPTPMGNNWRSATVAREGTCAYPVQGTAVGATLTCTVAGLNPDTSYDFQLMSFRPFGTTTINGRTSNIVTGRTSADTGGPAQIVMQGGNNQTGEVGTPLAQPLVIKVKDNLGDGIEGVTVTWSVSGGGGSVVSSTSRTDASGLAQMNRVLGVVLGQNRTTAFVSGLTPVEFAASAQAGPAAAVTVSPSELALLVGEDAAMQAAVRDRYGNPVTGASITWASSNPGVATVDGQGRVVGLGAGTAGVTASTATAAGVISASTMTAASATATAMAQGSGLTGTSTAPAAAAEGVSTVRVTGAGQQYPAEISRGGGNGQTGTVGTPLAQPFTVLVRDGNGSPLGGVEVSWVATSGGGSLSAATSVTGTNGQAQSRLTLGTTAGANAVAASVEGLDPLTFSATGTAGPAASIGVTPGSTSVAVGGTAQFTATIRDQHGNSVTGTPTWSSSSTALATVNSSGLATGVSAGSAEIRAAFSGLTGAATLSVASSSSGPTTNPGTVADLRVASTTSSSVTLNFTSMDDGAGSPARYQIRHAPTPLGWGWGTATPVANGTCAGAVQGGAIGTTVSCTVTGLSAGTSHDFQLVSYRGVLDGAAVFGNLSNVATGVTGASSPTASGTLAISPRGGTLTAVGSALQLSVTARSSSGSTISSPGATWTSSNANVATVDASGRVIARGLGTAIISVAASCCTGDQVSVSVTQEIASVSVSPSPLSVDRGSGAQLSAVARDANNNTIPGVTFTWSSSNTWVAGVSGTGYVTGSNAGSSTVTAVAGGRSATASVTVNSVSSPPPPPPSGGGSSQATPNRPSNIVFLTENGFNGTVAPSGWEYNRRSSQVRYVTDPTKPFGGQGAGEWLYTPGMGQGQNDPGAVGTRLAGGLREIYVSFLVRHSPGFREQTPGTKFCHFFMSSGNNLHLDKYNPTQPWGDMYGADAGQWALAPTGWSGGIPHWDDSRTPRPGFNNVNATAARVDYSGGWQTVELHLRYSSSPNTSDGIVRMWVDGQLTASYTNVRWPAGSFDWAPDCAGTYGGGSSTVTQEQWFRIGNMWVGRPQ